MNEIAEQSHMALRRVNIREAFVTPSTMDSFIGDLQRYSSTPLSMGPALEAEDMMRTQAAYGFPDQDPEDDRRKPFIYSNGVAVIAVHGTLLNRMPYSWGFVTGYAAIRKQINAIKADKAANPDDVQLVLFDHDSGGGESAGCQELAEEIAALDEIVPCVAVIDSLCCSASYMLAVPCRKVYAIPSATVGSIGVYRLHIDLSGAMSQAGVKYTYVKSGAHKVDGNFSQPLDPETEAKWQAAVDKSRQNFAQFVADHTGLSLEAVLATEAEVYKADDALDINLISGVMTPSQAVSGILAELADDEVDPDDGDEEMKTPQELASGSAAPAAAAPVIDQAAINAAVAAGVAAHMTTMRQRANSIRLHEAAKANPALANHLIDNTDMDSASAIATLEAAGPAAAPKAEPTAAEAAAAAAAGDGKEAPAPGSRAALALAGGTDTTNHLDNAMGGVKAPNIAGGGDGGGEQQQGQPENSLLATVMLTRPELARKA